MQYDRESGQVYTQEVIRVAPSSRRRRGFAWVHESPLLPAGWEAYSPVGAHSLKHMAMRAVLSDQRTLSTAHFKGVPWSVARYLWDCVCRRYAMAPCRNEYRLVLLLMLALANGQACTYGRSLQQLTLQNLTRYPIAIYSSQAPSRWQSPIT